MTVQLSERSKELLSDYFNGSEPHANKPETILPAIDLLSLVACLTIAGNEDTTAESEYKTAALYTELLNNLRTSLPGYMDVVVDEESTGVSKTKFIGLVLAGSLVAACEGFDGVTTVLGILSLPSLLVFIAGLAFSILSVVVFCGLDLVQVSTHLGISLSDAPKLLDIYVLQLKELKYLRRQIESYCLAELPEDNLLQLKHMVLMMQSRFKVLISTSKQFDSALNSTSMKVVKAVFTVMSGALFFGGGFFAGQSLALFVMALFFSSVPAFWPVVIFSACVGLAALAVYWYLERPSLQKLVSSWFGLDEDKIEQLCDTVKIEKESHKLELLSTNIEAILRLKQELSSGSLLEGFFEEAESLKIKQPLVPLANTKLAANRYLFYRPNTVDVIEDRELNDLELNTDMLQKSFI